VHVLLNLCRAAHRADKLLVLFHFPVKDIGRGVEILPRPGSYLMLVYLLVRRRVYREALHQCAAAAQRVKVDVPLHILQPAALLVQLYQRIAVQVDNVHRVHSVPFSSCRL